MLKRCLKLNRRIALCVAVIFLVAATAAPMAEAAVTPWSLTKLTLHADLIVRGRITKQSGVWNKEKTEIFTESSVKVLDYIKGWADGDSLVVRTPGGVVGDVGLIVRPAPRLMSGEEVLLFLEAGPAGGYRVTGSIQGQYAVRDGWAVNDEMGIVVPVTSFVRRVLAVMRAHGIPSSLSPDWVTRFPVATANPPDFIHLNDFTYSGYHWPGPNPMGEDYLVNVNLEGTDGVPEDQALEAIRSAADTWTDVSAADFEFTYGGASTATGLAQDDRNLVFWRKKGEWGGTLARTQFWMWCDDQGCSSGDIFEADVLINDYYNWDATGSPAGNEYDLQSVMLHESGHFLSLDHDGNSEAVMYPSISPGEVGRTLHQNDIDGIRFIYPGLRADIDGSSKVELDEVFEIANHWHLANSSQYDANGDGVVNVQDVMIAVTEWQATAG